MRGPAKQQHVGRSFRVKGKSMCKSKKWPSCPCPYSIGSLTCHRARFRPANGPPAVESRSPAGGRMVREAGCRPGHSTFIQKKILRALTGFLKNWKRGLALKRGQFQVTSFKFPIRHLKGVPGTGSPPLRRRGAEGETGSTRVAWISPHLREFPNLCALAPWREEKFLCARRSRSQSTCNALANGEPCRRTQEINMIPWVSLNSFA